MRLHLVTLCLAVFALIPGSKAATLSLNVSPGVIPVGGDVLIGLRIAGLGAEALATVDLDLSFNAAVLSFTGVEFGDPTLGDQLGLFGVDPIAFSSPGVGDSINFFINSLNTITELNANQANEFTILTARFTGIAPGVSVSSLNVSSLLNASAEDITLTGTGSATAVVAGAGVIPEPSTFGLAALAVVGLFCVKRRLAH